MNTGSLVIAYVAAAVFAGVVTGLFADDQSHP